MRRELIDQIMAAPGNTRTEIMLSMESDSKGEAILAELTGGLSPGAVAAASEVPESADDEPEEAPAPKKKRRAKD